MTIYLGTLFSRIHQLRRNIFPAVLGFLLLTMIAYASIPSAEGVISGCYKKSGGSLRVIDSPTMQCAANELPINWNQTGVQGVVGPAGPQGPAGISDGPAGGALDGNFPNPGIADGAVTSSEIKDLSISMNDLDFGSVSAPKMISGAAAANVWGNNQWAPVNATQRGYAHIRRDNVGQVFAESGGFQSISYAVPLAGNDNLTSHSIRSGDPVPEGCGGSFAEPQAEPGHLCVFYDPAYDAASVAVLGAFSNRYGALLRVDQLNNDSGCYCAIADVVWAMRPPLNR